MRSGLSRLTLPDEGRLNVWSMFQIVSHVPAQYFLPRPFKGRLVKFVWIIPPQSCSLEDMLFPCLPLTRRHRKHSHRGCLLFGNVPEAAVTPENLRNRNTRGWATNAVFATIISNDWFSTEVLKQNLMRAILMHIINYAMCIHSFICKKD